MQTVLIKRPQNPTIATRTQSPVPEIRARRAVTLTILLEILGLGVLPIFTITLSLSIQQTEETTALRSLEIPGTAEGTDT
jgi:hypothetical protein